MNTEMTSIDLLIAVQNEERAGMCCYDRQLAIVYMQEHNIIATMPAVPGVGKLTWVQYIKFKTLQEIKVGHPLRLAAGGPEVQALHEVLQVLQRLNAMAEVSEQDDMPIHIHPMPETEQ